MKTALDCRRSFGKYLFVIMSNKIIIFFVLILCICVDGESEEAELFREKLRNQTKSIEKEAKTFMKGMVKRLLPSLMETSGNSSLSSRCTNGFMKYISGLTSVKVWAMRMLDATSKPPSDILGGTLNDFGGFDQCLKIEVPDRRGNIEFRGQYCAIEARPFLPPAPKNLSVAKQAYAKPTDTLSEEMFIAGIAFYYLKFRFGACVPSACTLQDMKSIAQLASSRIKMDVQIPQCYVKEGVRFQPIHVAVIFILSLLLVACIVGTVVDYRSTEEKNRVLLCFSLISNYRRLMGASKGSEELKALHGLRALSMAYVILGHTYVWINFQLLRSPNITSSWFSRLDFGSILNGWIAVETFFTLSGLLTCYAVMNVMSVTKGRLNVPLYIFRRYIRLTPGLLLVMGLVYFLPLLSSGPFWYERVDPEIRSCSRYWWRSLLYISNWFGMKNICVHPTWYLSADFQLHVIAAIFLILLYRCPKVGLSLIAAFVLSCTAMVGALTVHWELPPLILISSGNEEQIDRTIDDVHFNTFTHAGPYFVGIVAGYFIHKHKDLKMSRPVVACGWLMSVVVSLTSLYGGHRWNIGEWHGPLLTALYAALHRTTFSVGVVWVAFACITGYGGIVNRFLSATFLAPVSRLTFLLYLLHSLVIWSRVGSRRERFYQSHYNSLYEYVSNVVVTLLITIPFYLLLEAPLANLERLAFTRAKEKETSGHLQANLSGKDVSVEGNDTVVPVELMSVKQVENGCNNVRSQCDLNGFKRFALDGR